MGSNVGRHGLLVGGSRPAGRRLGAHFDLAAREMHGVVDVAVGLTNRYFVRECQRRLLVRRERAQHFDVFARSVAGTLPPSYDDVAFASARDVAHLELHELPDEITVEERAAAEVERPAYRQIVLEDRDALANAVTREVGNNVRDRSDPRQALGGEQLLDHRKLRLARHPSHGRGVLRVARAGGHDAILVDVCGQAVDPDACGSHFGNRGERNDRLQ